jgi:hypothetical protein
VREPGIGGTCPNCGELHASEASWCANCGTPLSERARRRHEQEIDQAIAERQRRAQEAEQERLAAAAAAAEPAPEPPASGAAAAEPEPAADAPTTELPGANGGDPVTTPAERRP